MIKKQLNAKNLDCPLPLLKAKLSLFELKTGDILEVKATDPTSWEDFTSYAKISGNKLIKASIKKGTFTYVIKKK